LALALILGGLISSFAGQKSLAAPNAQGTQLGLDDIEDGIKQRDQQLGGITASFDDRMFARFAGKPDDLRLHETYRICQQGQNINFWRQTLNLKSGVMERSGEAAWNGQEETTIGIWPGAAPDHHDLVTGTVEVRRSNALRAYWPTFFGNRLFWWDDRLSEIFTAPGWKACGIRQIGKYAAAGIEVASPHGEHFEAWVDPSRDFAPVEMSLSNKGLKISMSEVTLINVQGVWVPAAATIAIDNAAIPNERSVELISTDDYKLRVPLEPNDFRVSFPRGTSVWDGIKNISYEVGKGVWIPDAEGNVHLVEPTADMDLVGALPVAQPATDTSDSNNTKEPAPSIVAQEGVPTLAILPPAATSDNSRWRAEAAAAMAFAATVGLLVWLSFRRQSPK
jgi:hypothetical protein